MRRTTAHSPPAGRRRRAPRLVLAAAVLAALALTPAIAAATGKAPVIVSLSSGDGGEITVGAKINPHGLKTSYELALVCHACGPAGYQPAVGQLPAAEEAQTVSLNLTGIEPGAYRFYAYATNADGEAFQEGELNVPPGSPCPDGCPTPNPPYSPPELPWANQSGNEAAERTVAEQRAKEHEEQQAKEAAEQRVAEAAALKRRQEEQAAQAETEVQRARETAARARQERERLEAEHPACRVPALKGDTLTAARRALAKAHCRLGAVHQPAYHHGTLRVSAQGTPAGEQLAGGARVALTLGAKQASRRRRKHQ